MCERREWKKEDREQIEGLSTSLAARKAGDGRRPSERRRREMKDTRARFIQGLCFSCISLAMERKRAACSIRRDETTGSRKEKEGAGQMGMEAPRSSSWRRRPSAGEKKERGRERERESGICLSPLVSFRRCSGETYLLREASSVSATKRARALPRKGKAERGKREKRATRGDVKKKKVKRESSKNLQFSAPRSTQPLEKNSAQRDRERERERE